MDYLGSDFELIDSRGSCIIMLVPFQRFNGDCGGHILDLDY